MIPKFRAWIKSKRKLLPVSQMIWHKGDISRILTVEGAVLDSHLAEDVVLMQSTGVFDKNGKEIFEGDVVNIFGEKLSKIYYSDGAFCVDILIGETPLHAFLSEQLEIIGNIHRNPELMEEVLND